MGRESSPNDGHDAASAEGRGRLRHVPSELSQATITFTKWGRWLDSRPWTTYCTLTFADARCRSLARCGDRIVEWIWRATGRGVVAFTCAEHGRRTGRLHFHALLAHGDHGRDILDRKWRRSYGIAHVRRYERGRGASFYVGKYTLKEAHDTGAYYLSGAGPGYERWQKTQTRPEIDATNQVPKTEADPETPRTEKALRAETPAIEAELTRSYNGSWWLDELPKTGYQQYLAELPGNLLQKHIDRIWTVR